MGFGDSVSGWIDATEDAQREWFGLSAEMLASAMNAPRPNGPLPHKDGNMMRSLRASTAPIAMGAPGEKYAAQDVGLVTATLDLDDTLFLGWQANYAHRQNYGFVGQDALGRNYNQTGAHFVEHGVSQWDQIKKQAWARLSSA